jgi:hypothetical protein
MGMKCITPLAPGLRICKQVLLGATDHPSATTRGTHFVSSSSSFSFYRALENPRMTEDPPGVKISVRVEEGWEAVEDSDTQGYTLYPN